jgi:hypothetical protein
MPSHSRPLASLSDLANCIGNGDRKTIEAWIAAGGRLDAPLGRGPLSALHHMARSGRWDAWLARRAPELRLDPDAREAASALSPLAEACKAGHLKTARALLALGADPDGADAPQGGPLHYCPDQVAFLEMLVEAGASINAPNRFGKTPLRQWVDCKHSGKFVERALELGADPKIRCALGETPLRAAMEIDLQGLTSLMIKAGCAYEDLLCLDPATNEPSADATSDGWPSELPKMLDRLVGGEIDAHGRLRLLLNLAGPQRVAEALAPADGKISAHLEACCRKGHWQMALLLMARGASWRGDLSTPHEPPPLDRMGLLGVCLWGVLRSAPKPFNGLRHGRLALNLAGRCAKDAATWSRWARVAEGLDELGGADAERARAIFGSLQAFMEHEALQGDLADAKRQAPDPKSPARPSPGPHRI